MRRLLPAHPLPALLLTLVVTLAPAATAGARTLDQPDFQAPRLLATAAGELVYVHATDFNDDGHQDVLTVERDGGGWAAKVRAGDGYGGFAAPATVASSPSPYAAADVGDFNGDRTPDIVVSETDGPGQNFHFVYLGADHDGHLTTVGTDEEPWPRPVGGLTVGHWVLDNDGTDDGVDDIAFRDGDYCASCTRGISAISPKDHTSTQLSPFTPLSAVLAAFDHGQDGDTDLLVGPYADRADPALVVERFPDFFFLRDYVLSGYAPVMTAAGDFDGNGRADVAAVSLRKGLPVPQLDVYGPTATTFPSRGLGDLPDAMVAGDFTGDGRADVGVFYHVNGDRFYYGDRLLATYPTANIGAKVAAAADVNEDGLDDLITADAAGQVQLRLSGPVDTTAPATPTVEGFPPSGYATALHLTLTGEEHGRFECQLDGGTFKACASPYAPSLANGAHVVAIRQVDPAHNVSARNFTGTVTIDTKTPAAPTVRIGPPATTTERTVRFGFSGEPDARYECAFDRAAYAPCASPASYHVALGKHTFRVRQTDRVGHTGPTTERSFTVTAPQRRPPPHPTGVTLITAATRTVPGHTFTVSCKPDRGVLRSCTVAAFARLHGNLVRIGTGSAHPAGAVHVKLTRKGLKLLHRIGGVKVSLRLRAVGADGSALSASGRVRLLPRRVHVLPTDGLFASGKGAPLAAGKRYVRRVARRLADAKRVTCVGYTDSIGSRAANHRLGLARAKAVCKLLRKAGVKAKLHTSSHGETSPRASNRSRRGRARNRRVELVVHD